MSLANTARAFFYQNEPYNREELLVNMDLFAMMKLLAFGNRMLSEAQEEATKLLVLGETLEANAVARDVSTIAKNLKSLQNAYNLALN
jgi:hypothetical protein